MAGIARKRDHRPQLVTRETRAGRKHRDFQPSEVIFMLRKFDDIEQLCRAFYQCQRIVFRAGIEGHDTATRSA